MLEARTVVPSNSFDAKGPLISAIEDDDPVMFLEPKRLYNGPFSSNRRTNYAIGDELLRADNPDCVPLGAEQEIAAETATDSKRGLTT